MEQKKIYPYLIDSKRIAGYYEMLLDDKFKLRIFNKKKDESIYNYFLPAIRNYLFWTYNLEKNSEFSNLENDLKAVICANYECNIFEKDNVKVICFNNGICFIVAQENDKSIKKLIQYKEQERMKKINIRDDKPYDFAYEDKEELMYAYILQLYKKITLNKLKAEIKEPTRFNKTKANFVDFIQSVYNVDITDKSGKYGKSLCEKWSKELELDRTYVELENEFDILYKNNKLNKNQDIRVISIVLCIILIIVGIINLINGLPN